MSRGGKRNHKWNPNQPRGKRLVLPLTWPSPVFSWGRKALVRRKARAPLKPHSGTSLAEKPLQETDLRHRNLLISFVTFRLFLLPQSPAAPNPGVLDLSRSLCLQLRGVSQVCCPGGRHELTAVKRLGLLWFLPSLHWTSLTSGVKHFGVKKFLQHSTIGKTLCFKKYCLSVQRNLSKLV